MDYQDWLTSPEAQQLCGLSKTQLAWLCRNQRILCDRRGRDWFIQRASLLAYLQDWHPEIFDQLRKRGQS